MFMQPSDVNSVFIHVGPIDFRKGINGLGCEVAEAFGDRFSGKNLFVFTNREKDRLRILYWDDTGFALWHKVLEQERFQWPKKLDAKTLKVSADQLRWLLAGLSIEEVNAHKKIDSARQFY